METISDNLSEGAIHLEDTAFGDGADFLKITAAHYMLGPQMLQDFAPFRRTAIQTLGTHLAHGT